jgi:ankyrin repeat protein
MTYFLFSRIIAARNKRLDVANLLLSFGADVNFANAVGDTPLHWAVCSIFDSLAFPFLEICFEQTTF